MNAKVIFKINKTNRQFSLKRIAHVMKAKNIKDATHMRTIQKIADFFRSIFGLTTQENKLAELYIYLHNLESKNKIKNLPLKFDKLITFIKMRDAVEPAYKDKFKVKIKNSGFSENMSFEIADYTVYDHNQFLESQSKNQQDSSAQQNLSIQKFLPQKPLFESNKERTSTYALSEKLSNAIENEMELEIIAQTALTKLQAQHESQPFTTSMMLTGRVALTRAILSVPFKIAAATVNGFNACTEYAYSWMHLLAPQNAQSYSVLVPQSTERLVENDNALLQQPPKVVKKSPERFVKDVELIKFEKEMNECTQISECMIIFNNYLERASFAQNEMSKSMVNFFKSKLSIERQIEIDNMSMWKKIIHKDKLAAEGKILCNATDIYIKGLDISQLQASPEERKLLNAFYLYNKKCHELALKLAFGFEFLTKYFVDFTQYFEIFINKVNSDSHIELTRH